MAVYGEYSMLWRRAAGQYWSGGAVAGQWATEPVSDTVAHIWWGDPAAWPPPTYERFERHDDWLLCAGYGHRDGRFLPQTVTAEQVTVAGAEPRPLPDAAGRQHYVAWEIGDAAYRLEAWGHMDWEGARIDFHHRQVWTPPLAGCGNAWYGDRVCVKQFEVWSDNSGDPGGPLVERVRRDHILARGIGPGFVVHDWRTGWHADLRYHWEWA